MESKILVPLDNDIKADLKESAAENNRSMRREASDIIKREMIARKKRGAK